MGVAALLHTAREVVARGGCLEVDRLSDEAQVAIRLMCARPGVPITTVASCDDAIRDLFTLGLALHALDTTDETAEIATSAIEVLDESIRQVRLHAHHLASRVEGRGDHKEIR